MATIKMFSAESEVIAAHGYDPDTKTLAVKFKSGKTYHYSGVDPATYTDFTTAKSLGQFFGTKIRGKFKTTPQENT